LRRGEWGKAGKEEKNIKKIQKNRKNFAKKVLTALLGYVRIIELSIKGQQSETSKQNRSSKN